MSKAISIYSWTELNWTGLLHRFFVVKCSLLALRAPRNERHVCTEFGSNSLYSLLFKSRLHNGININTGSIENWMTKSVCKHGHLRNWFGLSKMANIIFFFVICISNLSIWTFTNSGSLVSVSSCLLERRKKNCVCVCVK